MADTAAPPLSEPPGQVGPPARLATVNERSQRRRRQVLNAAETCFRRRGFHAASMAGVAAEAGMSVGQIYRDFESKEAIIAAVVERDLERAAERLAAIGEAPPEGVVAAVVNRLVSPIEDVTAHARPALFLEVLAEAARNPKIAAMVARQQNATRQWLTDLLASRGGAELGRDRLVEVVDVVQLVLAGLQVRAACEPNLDERRMQRLLRNVISAAAYGAKDAEFP